ncbi:MAG: ribose-phosphate diphosphokinase [Infirmifilum uzonense]|jgi:ribose-phosphate pyrophosphokinase|uniref:ribose-phosphate diphosphokinase n=1 Tax=Infirmifilum uzonense TaxID=1550241 RepID=UPI003C70ECA3
MNELIVLGGSTCTAIGLEVSRILGVEFQPVITREFPDGELYVRVPLGVSGKRVVLVECAGRRPNSALVESVLTVKTLLKKGAREVVLALPYFPYARQDEEFNPGEAESLRIVAEMLEGLGVSGIVTVDMHLHRFKSMEQVFHIKAVNVTAMNELASYLSQRYSDFSLVVGPDEEAEQWARVFSEKVNAPYIVLRKERRGDEDVEVRGGLPYKGRVVIVDDIISTGSTIAETASNIKAMGAGEILVACTHGLFVSGAESKIFVSGVQDIISTNSVPNPFARVSVAPALAAGLKRVMGDE